MASHFHAHLSATCDKIPQNSIKYSIKYHKIRRKWPTVCVLDHLLGKFVDCIIKLLLCMNFFAYCRYIFIDVVMIPRPWPRLLPTFESLATKHSFVLFQYQRNCLFLLVYSNRTLLELQTLLYYIFSKICASKFGVRLIHGCGLYMDVYSNYLFIVVVVPVHLDSQSWLLLTSWERISSKCSTEVDRAITQIILAHSTDQSFRSICNIRYLTSLGKDNVN